MEYVNIHFATAFKIADWSGYANLHLLEFCLNSISCQYIALNTKT
jgi:hypothetical protein